jgi:Flp pilus assembly protein TadG
MLTPRQSRAMRCVAAARQGVAALEFALLTPVMATMVIGLFDLSKAAILWEQTWNAARSIAESASTLALQPDGSTSLTQAQAQQALSTIFAAMPWLRAGIATGSPGNGLVPVNTVSAVLTSVSYQPNVAGCTSSCTYAATVQWSKAYSGNNFMTQSSVLRPCATLTQTNPQAAQFSNTVPTLLIQAAYLAQNTTAADPFLIADVKFTYTPYFLQFITGPVTFNAVSYWTVRSTAQNTATPWTTYTATSTQDPASVQCNASSDS